MCEIQFMKEVTGQRLTKKDLFDFANFMYLGGEYNDDAYGVYCPESGIIVKEGKKLDFDTLNAQLEPVKTSLLIGHNRYKTKGDNTVNENNHPFETEHFVVVHNGMIRNDEYLKKLYQLDYTPEVDSFIIPALLEFYYDTMYVEEKPESIIELVKLVAEQLYGSFSVIVHHKPTNRTFYFKERGTKFTFGLVRHKNRTLIIGTTKEQNISTIYTETIYGVFEYVPVRIPKFEPEQLMIYEINDKGIVPLCKFTEATYKIDYVSSNTKVTNTHVKPDGTLLTYDGYGNPIKDYATKSLSNKKLKKLYKELADEILEYLIQDQTISCVSRSYNPTNQTIELVFVDSDFNNEIIAHLNDVFSGIGRFSIKYSSKNFEKLVIEVDDNPLAYFQEYADAIKEQEQITEETVTVTLNKGDTVKGLEQLFSKTDSVADKVMIERTDSDGKDTDTVVNYNKRFGQDEWYRGMY